MKKTISLCFFMLFFSSMMYSQFKKFNLSDFKLPDIKRQRLDIGLGFDMQQSIQNSHNEGFDALKTSHVEFSNYDGLTYGLYRNSEKVQTEQSYSGNLTPVWRSEKTGSSRNTYFRLNSEISGTNIYRKYFHDKFFFESGLTASGYYNYYITNSDDPNTTDKNTTYNSSVKIPILVGKGRIERTEDARLAIYILEDLQKTGRLSRVPDENEILEIASFIAILKNERYFDYRLRRIEEIEKIDSFMQSRNLINKADAVYFTTVYDDWEYADAPIRESGNRVSAGVMPMFKYSGSHTMYETADPDEESDLRYTVGGMGLIFRLESKKPVNLYWQRNWSAGLSYSYNKDWTNNKISGNKNDYSVQEFTGGADYSLGYYPNSRTYVKLVSAIDASMVITDYRSILIDKEDYFVINPYVVLNMYYYFSPRLNLSANYNLGYFYSNSNVTYDPDNSQFHKWNIFDQHFSISFTYSFF